MSLNDVLGFLPVIILLTWAILLLLADLWIPRDRKGLTALLAGLGLLASLAATLMQAGRTASFFSGMVAVDAFATFLEVLFLLSGLAAVALAHDYLQRMGLARGEYYTLLLFSVSGMMLMASARDLIIVFLALEMVSIPLYILVGFARPRLDSEEGSLKYFLLGAFSSGFFLYGVSLVFAATGHTDLPTIMSMAQPGQGANLALLLAGAALLLVGLGFKVAAVPFHMWAPDVYQGAPSPVSGFMSVGAKAAGFAALMRVFVMAFPAQSEVLTPILWGLAALTMLVGNVLAVSQRNIKRLLAYSSIANAGYLLMALVPYQKLPEQSVASMLFFLGGYAFASFGAWAVVVMLERAEAKGLALEDYAGLGAKYPLLAVAMTIFMLSFTGIPPTLGFWGKFFLFRNALSGGYVGLALVGLLTSLASAYYYLRVVVTMFMQPGDPQVRRDFWLRLTVGVMAVLVLGFGLLPNALLRLASAATMWMK